MHHQPITLEQIDIFLSSLALGYAIGMSGQSPATCRINKQSG